MNEQTPERDATESNALSQLDVSGSGQQRRRLLRAFGAGGALAGAGLPFAAGATSTRPHCKKTGSSSNYHPTASAVGSLVGSVTGATPPVNGHGCSNYKHGKSTNWGSNWTNGHTTPRALTYDNCANLNNVFGVTKLKFWHVFELSDPGSSSPKYRNCCDILSTYPTSDEGIWLAAMLNANKFKVATPTVGQFTYTPAGVIALYKNSNPLPGGTSPADLNTKALTLFRDYLSQLTDV